VIIGLSRISEVTSENYIPVISMNQRKNINNLPPYPRLGEIYRILALAIDTKSKHKDVDRLAREGDYDWSLLPTLSEVLILTPLRKHSDLKFVDLIAQCVNDFHKSYINLVSTVQLDSLSRENALPLLICNYFALHGLRFISGVKQELGGPDLLRLLDPEQRPIAVVLEWLDQNEQQPLIMTAFPETTGSDRSDRGKVNKWSKGGDLPDMGSINLFADKLAEKVDAKKVLDLRCWLVIARALAFLEGKSPIPFRATMLRHLRTGRPDIDIRHLLSKAVIEAGEKYSALTMPALTLYEDLKRTTSKQLGNQAKTKASLEQFELLTKVHEPEGKTKFHVEWMNGRWRMLSGLYEGALPYYVRAAELANYRAGEQQKQIIEEALVLAAHLNNKPFLKQLKHRAIVFGLFSEPSGKEVVEGWEIDHLHQKFHQVFPTQGRFLEAMPEIADCGHLPFLVFNNEEMARLKPDLRNLDRVTSIHFIDGQVRRWPQLRLFASLGRYEEVAILLERGASVDRLDDAGGSALLCALQHATDTGSRQVLDQLLQYQHAKSTLDSVTNKKQLTPLFCAIDFGEPDVVEKLLEMGASPDLRANIVDETPLYHTLSLLGFLKRPLMCYNYLHQSILKSPDLLTREVLRRYNLNLAGSYGDNQILRNMMDDPKNFELVNKCICAMVEVKIGRHSIPKLLKIIELLLKHKANPNAQHNNPAAPGRTPLMLAAENDSAHAFDLMMAYGGDPYRCDSKGMDCRKIAMDFRSGEVVRYLRSKSFM
jgi:hypothetical protein